MAFLAVFLGLVGLGHQFYFDKHLVILLPGIEGFMAIDRVPVGG